MTLKTGDIMTLGAATIAPGATVGEAAKLMLEHRVSGLPVVADGRLVGIVTERDLLRRAETGTETRRPRWLEFLVGPDRMADDYVRAHAHRIEDVMTRDVVTVTPETPLADVVELFEDRDVKRLPVVDGMTVVGIVSRANLLQALARLADKEPGAGAGEGTRESDAKVRQHVMEALKKERWARGLNVEVVVRRGVVDLNGTTPDEHIRKAARVAAENVPGVKAVRDHMEIAEPPESWI